MREGEVVAVRRKMVMLMMMRVVRFFLDEPTEVEEVVDGDGKAERAVRVVAIEVMSCV